MRAGSNLAGTLVTTARYSPANLAFGTGTDAVRQMCSVVLTRYVGPRDRDGMEGKLETP